MTGIQFQTNTLFQIFGSLGDVDLLQSEQQCQSHCSMDKKGETASCPQRQLLQGRVSFCLEVVGSYPSCRCSVNTQKLFLVYLTAFMNQELSLAEIHPDLWDQPKAWKIGRQQVIKSSPSLAVGVNHCQSSQPTHFFPMRIPVTSPHMTMKSNICEKCFPTHMEIPS